jgi:hypothetical protein
MTASVVHVTDLTPGSECNPSRAYAQQHQLMTASMVHDDRRYGPRNQSDTREWSATVRPGGDRLRVRAVFKAGARVHRKSRSQRAQAVELVQKVMVLKRFFETWF